VPGPFTLLLPIWVLRHRLKLLRNYSTSFYPSCVANRYKTSNEAYQADCHTSYQTHCCTYEIPCEANNFDAQTSDGSCEANSCSIAKETSRWKLCEWKQRKWFVPGPYSLLLPIWVLRHGLKLLRHYSTSFYPSCVTNRFKTNNEAHQADRYTRYETYCFDCEIPCKANKFDELRPIDYCNNDVLRQPICG